MRSLADATAQVKALSRPFLNWAGKAERLSFDVPTLPLFVHDRLSTQAIVETLKSHRKDAAQADMFDLFGDPKRSLADAITKAYEHQDKWVNRLILGGRCHANKFRRVKIGSLSSGSSRGSGSPRPERFVSEDAKRAAGSEMTLDVERVVDGGVNGQEPLG